MLKNNLLAKSVKFALIGGAASAALSAAPVFAAEEKEEVERISVTGSRIKQTDLEGALPVQIISQADIARTGVTSTQELIQQLPSMQGFTTPTESVGGGGGGISTASIHDLGEQFTLVLINNRRLAPSDSAGTIDLNSIPLSAIERVEVLTDGASALYGSDAIAGVVNFILKEEQDETVISARYDKPQEEGGENLSFSVSTGFGNLDNDGYSVVLSYSHDKREQLASLDRDFAKTGFVEFNRFDQNYLYASGSGNAIPGNARFTYSPDTPRLDDEGNPILTERVAFNPYASANGACAEFTSPSNLECVFDFTSTIEIVPENQRDSFYLNGRLALTDDISLFSTVAYSNFQTTARIAPYPTGWFNLPLDSDLVKDNVLANIPDSLELSETEKASITGVQARWRALPAGNRTTEIDTKSFHVVAGVEGLSGEVDWSAALTYSENDRSENYPTGWLIRDDFLAAVSSGAINVFVPAADLDADSQAALDQTIYSGDWEQTKVTLKGFDASAALPVFDVAGGEAFLAVGVDYRNVNYSNSISEANANEDLLFLSKGTEYDLTRSEYGVYAEVEVPLLDELLLSGSVRYDGFTAVDDELNGGDVNDSDSEITYKLKAKWDVADYLSLRASFGTGFKAPSMLSIARPRVDFGVTGASYDCPFSSSDPLSSLCLTGESQYNVVLQGNTELKSQKSEQTSAGFVYSPSSNFGLTVDYWKVDIEDTVSSLTQDQIFAGLEQGQFRELVTTKRNLSTGEDELAIIQASVNLGSSTTSGIDWNATFTNELSFGELKTSWSGTYILESEYTKAGTTDEFESSLGKFGNNGAVTFRLLQQLTSTLTHGDFAHTVQVNYKSGYSDAPSRVQEVNTDGTLGDFTTLQLDVPSYVTVDYLTQYNVMDNFDVTFGINNLFDREPPLTLNRGGGHQVGYDPRYTDQYGRTFYLSGNYRF